MITFLTSTNPKHHPRERVTNFLFNKNIKTTLLSGNEKVSQGYLLCIFSTQQNLHIFSAFFYIHFDYLSGRDWKKSKSLEIQIPRWCILNYAKGLGIGKIGLNNIMEIWESCFQFKKQDPWDLDETYCRK